MEEPEKKKLIPRRMDFINKIISCEEDDDTLLVEFEMIPNPERYESIEFEGKPAFLDKSTGTVIPWDGFETLAKGLEGCPIVSMSPKQTDYCAFLKERRSELLENWDKEYSMEFNQMPVEGLLKELNGKETYIVILYVDLEGSTRLSSEIKPETYRKIIKIFLMEMSKIIDNFNGYVLKFVGDCAIGIFPAEGNFPNTCDNAIQAAIIMRSIVEDVINPVFVEKGLPQIGFHIGIDIGLVKADSFGALNIASIIDLIDYPMNLTAKIQSKSGHNGILVGRQLYELLHINLQNYCERVDLEGWSAKDPQRDEIYKVYRCKAKWVCNCGDK
jgi:adenylate cyclase